MDLVAGETLLDHRKRGSIQKYSLIGCMTMLLDRIKIQMKENHLTECIIKFDYHLSPSQHELHLCVCLCAFKYFIYFFLFPGEWLSCPVFSSLNSFGEYIFLFLLPLKLHKIIQTRNISECFDELKHKEKWLRWHNW